MVSVMTRPTATGITEEDSDAIFALLQGSGGMTTDQVASELCLDEIEVAFHLANEAGMGNLDWRCGRYSAWHWL